MLSHIPTSQTVGSLPTHFNYFDWTTNYTFKKKCDSETGESSRVYPQHPEWHAQTPCARTHQSALHICLHQKSINNTKGLHPHPAKATVGHVSDARIRTFRCLSLNLKRQSKTVICLFAPQTMKESLEKNAVRPQWVGEERQGWEWRMRSDLIPIWACQPHPPGEVNHGFFTVPPRCETPHPPLCSAHHNRDQAHVFALPLTLRNDPGFFFSVLGTLSRGEMPWVMQQSATIFFSFLFFTVTS